MDTKINQLKISLFIEITLGIIFSISAAYFMVTMAVDSDESTGINIIMGAVFAVFLVAIPLVLLPILSVRELNEYAEQKSLFMSYINSSIVMGFVFFPMAIWQIYTLKKLKSYQSETE